MLNFFWAALLLYAIVVFGSYTLSRMGRLLVRWCRYVFGKTLTQIFVDSPSVFLHEACHLLVAILFGHQITSIGLKGVFVPGAGGHVETRYNPRSIRQRLGLSIMALAPVAVPMLLLIAVVADHYGLPQSEKSKEWICGLFAFEPGRLSDPWVLVVLYLHLLISATMRLSVQDWRTMARGGIVWMVLLAVLSLLFHGGAEPMSWLPTVVVAGCFALSLTTKAAVLAVLFFLALVRFTVEEMLEARRAL